MNRPTIINCLQRVRMCPEPQDVVMYPAEASQGLWSVADTFGGYLDHGIKPSGMSRSEREKRRRR